MADYGAEYTDKKIEELEKRITSIYREASHDVEMKMRDFNKRYKAKEAIYAKKLKNGEITQEDFNAWKRGQVFQGKQWQAKKQQLEDTLYNANSVAVKMVNGEINGIFAVNANFMSYSLESGAGVNFGFGLYDESTVVNLIKNEPDLLPKPRIKKPKDTAWNSKKITRQVTQGIIQGESLDQIATRLAKTTGSQNRGAMLTHARTAMTGAQNAGRQYQLGKAQDLGIKLKKEWMATLDSHTRDTHKELDGQRVPIDGPFEAGGYSIMYPGDPSAAPAMVYNCRCTMTADVEDYPAEYNRYDNIEGKLISNMTYREWEKAKSGVVPTVSLKPKFSVSDITRGSITPESASEDWFEYENANAMREYIETGEMPMEYMFSGEIDRETRERLAAEAELMQNIGATTKTNFKTLYRGMVLDEDDARSMFTPGEQYTFNTLSATTSDRGIAKIYMDPENAGGEGVPVILEIQKSDGIYGFDRDGSEIVIPKGSEFRVVKNWMDENGIVHISLYAKKGKNVK